MSGPELTRWNRAGLDRFRYIEGNAAIAVAVAIPHDFFVVIVPEPQLCNPHPQLVLFSRGEVRQSKLM